MSGAAKWLTSSKAMICLNLRGKCNDRFWFTFFHEIGHLLLHSKKDTFINDVGAHSGVEQEADGFASQIVQSFIPERWQRGHGLSKNGHRGK